MTKLPLAAVLALFLATLAPAADLTKIDRAIKKEPVYQTKSPKYGLIVFGPEAAFRVWLALDGDVLHVDRNGDGDLSAPEERVPGTPLPKGEGLRFPIGEIKEPDGQGRRAELEVRLTGETALRIAATIHDPARKLAGVRCRGTLPLADRPAEARVLHLNGPLEMRFDEINESNFLFVAVGTPGLGTFAVLDVRDVPADHFPTAEFQFPARLPGKDPIRLRFGLRH